MSVAEYQSTLEICHSEPQRGISGTSYSDRHALWIPLFVYCGGLPSE